MENATRALTMAGGILIALMILGALFLMFNNLSSYQNQNDTSTKSTQIAEFNNQFEPYNKKDLTLMELHSVYNKVESNNNKNKEYTINMRYEFNDNHEDKNLKTKFESGNFSAIQEAEKMNSKFNCIDIQYNGVDGRISYIEFKDITSEVNSWIRVERD